MTKKEAPPKPKKLTNVEYYSDNDVFLAEVEAKEYVIFKNIVFALISFIATALFAPGVVNFIKTAISAAFFFTRDLLKYNETLKTYDEQILNFLKSISENLKNLFESEIEQKKYALDLSKTKFNIYISKKHRNCCFETCFMGACTCTKYFDHFSLTYKSNLNPYIMLFLLNLAKEKFFDPNLPEHELKRNEEMFAALVYIFTIATHHLQAWANGKKLEPTTIAYKLDPEKNIVIEYKYVEISDVLHMRIAPIEKYPDLENYSKTDDYNISNIIYNYADRRKTVIYNFHEYYPAYDQEELRNWIKHFIANTDVTKAYFDVIDRRYKRITYTITNKTYAEDTIYFVVKPKKDAITFPLYFSVICSNISEAYAIAFSKLPFITYNVARTKYCPEYQSILRCFNEDFNVDHLSFHPDAYMLYYIDFVNVSSEHSGI